MPKAKKPGTQKPLSTPTESTVQKKPAYAVGGIAANTVHYCRFCKKKFSTKDGVTAHTRVRRHQRTENRTLRLAGQYGEHYYIRPVELKCDKDCHLKQQPEELRTGYRLYGEHLKKRTVTPILKYEEAFPDD